MSDYEVTRIDVDQSGDPLTYFSLISYCDPVTFKHVIKKQNIYHQYYNRHRHHHHHHHHH